MAKVYLAGPMRGYPKFNFPAFDRARDLGVSLNWKVISPADIDRASGVHEGDDQVEFSWGHVRAFAERDTQAILSLRAEEGDAIALLPGWENSKGATCEYYLARWLGLAILDATNFHFYPAEKLHECLKSQTAAVAARLAREPSETVTTPNHVRG